MERDGRSNLAGYDGIRAVHLDDVGETPVDFILILYTQVPLAFAMQVVEALSERAQRDDCAHALLQTRRLLLRQDVSAIQLIAARAHK